MSTLTKYLLFQVPGWVLAAIILAALAYWIGIPRWVALALFLLWVVKDLIIYRFLKSAYESGVKTGVDQLIGAQGVAQEDLAPNGYIRVRGELWRAETKSKNDPIPSGSKVRVIGAQGAALIVETENAPKGNLSGS